MTLAATSRVAGPFNGTGSLVSYPFTFKVFEAADVEVVLLDSNGLEQTAVNGSTCLVTVNADQDASPGGSVQYAVAGVATALPLGYSLTITGAGLEFTQEADLPSGGNFNPITVENALDRTVALVQIIREEVARALQVAVSTPAGFNATLPTPAAGEILGWNGAGTGFANYPVGTAEGSALAIALADATAADGGDTKIGWGAIVSIFNGVLTRHASLQAAVAAISTNRCTVVVRKDVVMTASATFPSTARLWVDNRARITTTGYTLTTNQTEPIAPPVQCFTGTGSVIMNNMPEVLPEWWGALVGDSTDCAAAINAADAAACVGTLGLDGVTVVAKSSVRFQPGTYRVNSILTYRGAPWRGAGPNATVIKGYHSSGALVDAVGTTGNRKMLSVSGITFNGTSATGTAYGFRLGYNQRSYPAFDNVRIDAFPGPGIYFADQTWSMSFRDLYLSFNAADDKFSGIYQDPSIPAGGLVALEFFNLQLENNGKVASGKSGGMQFTGVQGFRFFGGVWEGNYGTSEAHFIDAEGVWVYGGHIESDVGSVDHGMLFTGASYGAVYGMTNTAEVGFAGAGAAIYVGNTSKITIDSVRSDSDWVTNLAVADTAVVNLVGECVLPVINLAGTGQLHRHTPKRVALTDAATIATNAVLGTEFYVTLGGNRTIGAPTQLSVGQEINYVFIQDATGGRTVTFNAIFKVSWSDTGNTANKRSSVRFSYDGTNLNQIGAQSPYI